MTLIRRVRGRKLLRPEGSKQPLPGAVRPPTTDRNFTTLALKGRHSESQHHGGNSSTAPQPYVFSTKNREPYHSAGHRNEVSASMLNMIFDISGSSDTTCVALSGLRYALGNRSGALRHPAGVVRTLRAQDEKRLLNINRQLIVHVRRSNRSTICFYNASFLSASRQKWDCVVRMPP
jgi:hypothetical protein